MPPTFTTRSWLTLIASFFVLTVAFAFGTFALPPIYPSLVKTFGWSRASVNMGNSINLLLIGVLSPMVGILVDKFTARIVILGGTCVLALALALQSLTNSLGQYYAFCVLLGIGTSAVSILPNSILIGPLFRQWRGLAVGFINAGIGLGGYIAPILITSQIAQRGVPGTFLVLAACMAIPFLLTIALVRSDGRRSSRPETGRVPTAAELARMPLFWIFGVTLFCTAHAMIAIQQNLILYLTGEGVAAIKAAHVLATAQGAAAIGKLISGILADKVSARSGVVFSVVCVMLGILALLITPPRSGLVYALAIVFGSGFGGIFNASPTIVFEHFGTHHVGKALGLFYIFFGLGTASGGLLAGYLFDRTHSYSTPFTVDLVLAGVALLLLLATRRQTRRPPRVPAVALSAAA